IVSDTLVPWALCLAPDSLLALIGDQRTQIDRTAFRQSVDWFERWCILAVGSIHQLRPPFVDDLFPPAQ
ncbi:MAG: hypothetical protein RMK79_12570, partial [Anaerolineae bacterium]|nr:hypothetical protein [Anaerolineae bacterium]